MIIGTNDVVEVVNTALDARQAEQTRLRRIGQYVRGRQDPPYIPRGVNAEYRWIAKKARRNFLPLVVSVISENLHVDGYRPSGTTANEVASPQKPQPEWDSFRANRMVSRQHGVHRSVIKYGAAYTLVLPGQMSSDEEQLADVPVIRPVSPRRMTAFYADPIDDEWPQFAIEVDIKNLPKGKQQMIVYVYDEEYRYILQGNVSPNATTSQLQLADASNALLQGQPTVAQHSMGICPVVRFLYEVDLDGEEDCIGEIEPIMPIQDQINFDTFNLMISTQFAAFRQRYVSGMSPVDEDGKEQAPFRPGVDRVWASDDPTTKFGEFGETALQPYSLVREDGIRHMSTICQVPPYHLLGQVANMSAEALAAARDGFDRKVEELQAALTDPWRNVFRLVDLASGNDKGWNDLFGTIVWRDTSARAFTSTIQGLVAIAQQLGVPATELWQRIPGATADDVASWQLAYQRQQAQAIVQNMIQQQAAAAQAAAGATTVPPGSVPPGQAPGVGVIPAGGVGPISPPPPALPPGSPPAGGGPAQP